MSPELGNRQLRHVKPEQTCPLSPAAFTPPEHVTSISIGIKEVKLALNMQTGETALREDIHPR